MIRRLRATWASTDKRSEPAPAPVRVLAVSDEVEPAFDFERNREGLMPLDGIIGAGDLKPQYLDFLAEAFRVPLLYVLGNHDRGGGWQEGLHHVPDPIDGSWHELAGLAVAGLSWPSDKRDRAVHDDNAAWRQVAARYLKLRGHRPDIIVSHVPPAGLGDTPEDHYHRGFAAYRWLIERLKPVLWIHGHTAPAAATHWWVQHGLTTVVNVTGAVLLELAPSRVQEAVVGSVGATIDEGLDQPALALEAVSEAR